MHVSGSVYCLAFKFWVEESARSPNSIPAAAQSTTSVTFKQPKIVSLNDKLVYKDRHVKNAASNTYCTRLACSRATSGVKLILAATSSGHGQT